MTTPDNVTDSVAQAVRFLADPRLNTATAEAKQNFLRMKGLTDAEINQAMGHVQTQPGFASSFYSAPANAEGLSFWGFLATTGGFVAAMATGAFLYELWLQKTREAASICTPNNPKISNGGRRDSGDGFELKRDDQDEIIKTLKEISARQEQRHAEHARMLRDLTTAVAELKLERETQRKAGGSVVLSRASSTNEGADEQQENLKTSSPVAAEVEALVLPAAAAAPAPAPAAAAEDFGMEALDRMASELKDHPSRPTVLMILQNLSTHFEDERFRRINLSSPRFKEKIGQGVALEILKAAGFKNEAGVALVFPQEGTQTRVATVLRAVEGFVESE